MIQPTTSAIAALPAANHSELSVVATKRRPPITFWKFSKPHRTASLEAPAMITLPCSRNMSGGTTSAASTTINRTAIQAAWRADEPDRDFGSAEEVIENLLPFPQVVFARLWPEHPPPHTAIP